MVHRRTLIQLAFGSILVFDRSHHGTIKWIGLYVQSTPVYCMHRKSAVEFSQSRRLSILISKIQWVEISWHQLFDENTPFPWLYLILLTFGGSKSSVLSNYIYISVEVHTFRALQVKYLDNHAIQSSIFWTIALKTTRNERQKSWRVDEMVETGAQAHQILQTPASALRVPDNGADWHADFSKG